MAREGGGEGAASTSHTHQLRMRGRDPVSGIYSGSAAAFSLPIRESLCIKSRRTTIVRIRVGKTADRAVSALDEDARRTPDKILRGNVILQARSSVTGLRLPVQH